VLKRLKNDNRGYFLWVSSGEGDDILRGWNRGEAAKVRVFPTRKNCLFFLTGLKMVVGVGFCKIKVDSNFLLVLKIKCTKFHQDRSKTVDLHTKYTNRHSVLYIYRLSVKLNDNERQMSDLRYKQKNFSGRQKTQHHHTTYLQYKKYK
jgi:hypothetical protein